MNAFREIDDCKDLYLDTLSEPRDNVLKAVVLEARSATIASPAHLPITNISPIEHTQGCRVFEITWDSYIAYSVRNESYAQSGSDAFEGHLFRLCSKSHFLDYVASATIATSDYPGPFRHWSISCLNHVVDVVSQVEPIISVRVERNG
jgi:hypothetical protein